MEEMQEILDLDLDDDERQEIASLVAQVEDKVTEAAAAMEALQEQMAANRAM